MPGRYRILDTPTGGFAVCEADDGGLRTRWVSGPDDPLVTHSRQLALRQARISERR